MSELLRILEILVADVEADWPVALCVVLAKHGSGPQTPGATMLVRSDASTVGTVGGGANEAEVRRRALELLKDRRSALLELVLDGDYGWDDSAICGGKMTIGVTTVTRASGVTPFATALASARNREPAYVPIVVEHAGKRLEYRLNLDVPPMLVIAGAGHVGQALARLAVDVGFHVVVIDDRGDVVTRERFPDGVELELGDIAETLRKYPLDGGCYVVIVTRGHQHDHQALKAVIDRPAGYIGMIGSKRKSTTILKALRNADVSQELIDRVHTPIGVPIGAVTVSEIAVSIVAELIQVRRQSVSRLIEGPFEMTTQGTSEGPGIA